MSTQPLGDGMMGDPNAGAGGAGSSAGTVASVMGLMNSAKEKWDSSGANDAVGRLSQAIPESTKSYVGSMFNREHLRSITVYFGIGEERAFYVEKNPALLAERIRHNLAFFYLNYMALTAVLFCLTLLISPSAIIGIGLLALAWMWIIRASSSGSLQVGTFAIPQKTVTILMGAVSVFVLIWVLSSIFWWTAFSSGLLIGVHALFRDASMHKDMNDAVAMEGDLHFQPSGPVNTHDTDAQFLNAV